MAVSLIFRKFDKMFKKAICFVSFFIGASLVASQELELTDIQRGPVSAVQSSGDDRQELQEACCHLPRSCEQSCRSTLMNCHENTQNGYALLRDTECSSDDCQSCMRGVGALCIITGIIVVSVLSSQSDIYRVYNRDSYNIEIHYQPGCGNNKDCVKTIRPNNHAKIRNQGHLNKLCAYKSSELFGHRECVTKKSLKYMDWYVHNGLTFSRGKDDSSQVNETAASFRSYQNQTHVDVHASLKTYEQNEFAYNSTLAANAQASHHNLRGFISQE